MRAYGNTHYVSGRDSVPLPARNHPITPRVPDVVCGCGHRGRPGAFHICIDLTEPEPPAPPRPVLKLEPPKPAPEASRKRRGGKPALNENQSVEAARMYVERQMSMLAVANHFGVSQNAVHSALKRLNVPRRATWQSSSRGGAA